MNRRTAGVLGSMTGLAAMVALVTAPGATAGYDRADTGDEALRAIGLTDNDRLVRFDTDSPDDLKVLGKVSGPEGDTDLVGIDFRVQNGRLYGVGDLGGIYTIGTQRTHADKVSQLSVAVRLDRQG